MVLAQTRVTGRPTARRGSSHEYSPFLPSELRAEAVAGARGPGRRQSSHESWQTAIFSWLNASFDESAADGRSPARRWSSAAPIADATSCSMAACSSAPSGSAVHLPLRVRHGEHHPRQQRRDGRNSVCSSTRRRVGRQPRAPRASKSGPARRLLVPLGRADRRSAGRRVIAVTMNSCWRSGEPAPDLRIR